MRPPIKWSNRVSKYCSSTSAYISLSYMKRPWFKVANSVRTQYVFYFFLLTYICTVYIITNFHIVDIALNVKRPCNFSESMHM